MRTMVQKEKHPEVSIIIPIHNEEKILTDAVTGLLYRLDQFCPPYEILLMENGSQDGTAEAARKLAQSLPQVKAFSGGPPDYGRALKEGIERARGKYCLCDEIDICDVDFYRSALGLMQSGRAEMVIGSKLAPGARDERPLIRNLASRTLCLLLKAGAGLRGTDTHGPKGFLRERLVPIAMRCRLDGNLFASELVLRAERAGVRITELPLSLREKRAPTINLLRRVPAALRDLVKLVWMIRREDFFGENR
jgi:glycosyltransferase involved in cell wall biosynthesis